MRRIDTIVIRPADLAWVEGYIEAAILARLLIEDRVSIPRCSVLVGSKGNVHTVVITLSSHCPQRVLKPGFLDSIFHAIHFLLEVGESVL